MPGMYTKKKTKAKTCSMAKAIPTAEFNKKIAAVKANPSLTPAQKQTKINQMKSARIARKSAMKSTSKRR